MSVIERCWIVSNLYGATTVRTVVVDEAELDLHRDFTNVTIEGPFVPASQLQGAVSDRDALAKHLEYALDALEGKPWTGWNTDDARAILSRARGQSAPSPRLDAPNAIDAAHANTPQSRHNEEPGR